MHRRDQIVSINDNLRNIPQRKRQQREREAITDEIVLQSVVFMLKFYCVII